MLAVGLVVAALSVTSTGIAQAASSIPSPAVTRGGGVPSTNQLVPSGDQTGQAVALSANPWNCYFRADNPHRSTHGPYDVNAEGWNFCSGPGLPASAGVDETLYRQDCVLFVCWWTDVRDASTNHPPTSFSGSPPSIHANALYNCNGTSRHTYELDVYAWAKSSGGTLYSNSGASNDVPLDCG